jgi:hypothetical protein
MMQTIRQITDETAQMGIVQSPPNLLVRVTSEGIQIQTQSSTEQNRLLQNKVQS